MGWIVRRAKRADKSKTGYILVGEVKEEEGTGRKSHVGRGEGYTNNDAGRLFTN